MLLYYVLPPTIISGPSRSGERALQEHQPGRGAQGLQDHPAAQASLRESSVNIGAKRRILAGPLPKDDAHKPRGVNNFEASSCCSGFQKKNDSSSSEEFRGRSSQILFGSRFPPDSGTKSDACRQRVPPAWRCHLCWIGYCECSVRVRCGVAIACFEYLADISVPVVHCEGLQAPAISNTAYILYESSVAPHYGVIFHTDMLARPSSWEPNRHHLFVGRKPSR